MTEKINYKKTIFACNVANFIQASVINLTPILFIPLKEQYNLSYSQFGILVLVNFITQFLIDIIASKPVDKYGFKPFILSSHAVCSFGFILFALSPFIFKSNIFIGLLISTVIFSASGGLFELLLSPIVDSIPCEHKEKSMAMLHSFYSWGQVTVVLITTILVFLNVSFTIIVLFWSIIPIINLFFFATSPIPQKNPEGKGLKIRFLIKNKLFIFCFFAIMFGGAAEVTISQWSSVYIEKGLAIPKLWGDLIGTCGFAISMGVGRLFFGLKGEKYNLRKIILIGSVVSALCYITVAVSPISSISIIACILNGLCVALLWPGTLSIASAKFPLAGASMFALLAAGGDIGAATGPYFAGIITDFSSKFGFSEQQGLKSAMLICAIIPLICFLFHMLIKKDTDRSLKEKN